MEITLRPATDTDRAFAREVHHLGYYETTNAGRASTGRKMFAMPADAPLRVTWEQAMEYAANVDAYGHKDWRVPWPDELKELFKNQAAIGDFTVSERDAAGKFWAKDVYWSKEKNRGLDNYALAQDFSDGKQDFEQKQFGLSLRCVRG